MWDLSSEIVKNQESKRLNILDCATALEKIYCTSQGSKQQ